MQTTEAYFEIEDTNAGEIVLHTTKGFGMGKFSNKDVLDVTVFNYDKFITSIQEESFKSGRQRCDILLNSSNSRYFVLGEIKDRAIINKKSRRNVRKGATDQLLASLQTILFVPEIATYIKSKTIKRCCYFNKQSASPSILIVTTAFNRLSNFYPEGFKMNKPDIEAFDFDFYEYTGEQTMTLSN
ncbi:MAG: hypothetical protein ABI378_01410 [Chitinophagaceae bacterium]